MVTLMRFNIFLIFVFIFAYVLSTLYTSITKNNIELFNNYLNTGLYLSVLLIISLTMLPVTTTLRTSPELNLIPFRTILLFFKNGNLIDICANVIGNTILFIPLGFFGYIKSKENFDKTLKLCLYSTLFVEFMQIILPARCTDIDDIILNTLGGFIGIILAKVAFTKVLHTTKN